MYKEIVTKAVVGKGKKYFKNNYDVVVDENVNTILGCWVINHEFKGYVSNNKVIVDGSLDVNIWYSFDNDTKTSVVIKNISYSETLNVKLNNDISINNSDIIIRILKQPNCINVTSKDDVISFDIEKELGAEVVSDEKVKISVLKDDDKWDDLDDDIDNSVKEDFI